MPLQVSTAPTSPLLMSSLIGNKVRESNVMPESISNRSNTAHRLGAAIAVGDDRPIVLNRAQAQNSLEGGNLRVPKATWSSDSPIESRHAKIFSEHRKTTSIDDTYQNSNEQLPQQQKQQQQYTNTKDLPSNQLYVIEDNHHDTIIQHSTGSAVAEERNRKPHLGLSTIDSSNITHINRRRIYDPHYQQQLQHQHALAGLTHLPQPHAQYTATAAEIALGITPSYSLSRNMSDVSRVHPMTSYADTYRDSKRDASSFQRKEMDEDASKTSV